MGFFDNVKDKLGGVVKCTPIIRATMMGPRAVGKTSIMASIFSETRDSVAGTELFFRSSAESFENLKNKRLALMRIFDEKKSLHDEPQTGVIAASNAETKFSFEMGFIGREKTVDIEITDFPGEYLISQQQKVLNYISESQVVMIAIDTPYMMEENGKYNEEKNNISLVTNFITNHSEEIKDKLIMFVPLKSERYFHEGKIESVKYAVENAYASIIAFCKTANIACVVTPIQTLGGVEFDHFVDNTVGLSTATKLSKYRFCGSNAKYEPLFCVQPMYYLLTYVANYYAWIEKQPKNIWENLKNSLFSMLKNNDKFFFEIKKMSKNIVVGKMGYEIIYSNTILNIK